MLIKALIKLSTLIAKESRLVILTYHRVLAEADYMYPNEPDIHRFENQIHWLLEYFPVVRLDEGLKRLQDKHVKETLVAITFDDGYKDNLEHALPILEEHGLKAAFFVVSGAIAGGMMWNDIVAEACRRTPVRRINVNIDGVEICLSFASRPERLESCQKLIGSLKYLKRDERDKTMAYLISRLQVSHDDFEDLMMDKEELRQLVNKGMLLGAHAQEHEVLNSLSDEEARAEVTQSRRDVEEIIGRRISHYAYPNGKYPQDYSDKHIDMVRQAGYEYAFSTNWGSCSYRSNALNLPRVMPWKRHKTGFIMNIIQAVHSAGEPRQ